MNRFDVSSTPLRHRLIILVCFLSVFSLFYQSDLRQVLTEKTLDLLFHLRGPIPPGHDVTVVAIDENTLHALGSWPIARKYHATLLGHLKQAKAIGFDILFVEPAPDDDLFSSAIQARPPVIFAVANTLDNHFLVPPQTLKGYAGIGHIQVILDHGGTVRRVVLRDRDGIPALSKAMLKAVGQSDLATETESTSLINFYGPKHTFTTLSYQDILEDKIPAGLIKDRFVLVGLEASGMDGACFAPFSNGPLLSGVEVQATILQNLLDNTFLIPLPWAFLGALILVTLIQLVLWPVFSEIQILCLNLFLALMLFVISVYLFTLNYFFNFTLVLVFLTVAWLTHLVFHGIWISGKLSRQIHALDRELAHDLHLAFAHSEQLQIGSGIATHSSLLHHVNRLNRCVAALTLQHHFIDQLLKKDMPPLALWNQEDGKAILYSESFVSFWQRHGQQQKETIPSLETFTDFLQNNRLVTEDTTSRDEQSDEPLDNKNVELVLTTEQQIQYYQVTLRTVEASGRIGFRGVLSIFSDVTKIRRLERLKNDTVSFVSHELRRPLTTIRGYAEMLLDGLETKQRLYAETISSQTMRLNRLISAFLDITRLQQGDQQIRQHPIKLASLIADTVANLQERARQKNIIIHTIVPENVRSGFTGDETLLLQALINLVENSIKFSHPGGETLLHLQEFPDYFQITIRDHGPGIPAEIRPYIFNAFFRGNQGRSEHGFGLGLALVDQVIRAHGGKIILEDTEQGCCFHLHLPKNTGETH